MASQAPGAPPQGQADTTPVTSTQPGRPGSLSPGQQHTLNKFRKSIQDKGLFVPERHDDPCLCRFLRARKWDLAATESMFVEAEQWRRNEKVDELYETFRFPEKEAVQKIYPQYYHKTDNVRCCASEVY